MRAQLEPRTQSARESMAKPEIERGRGSGEGLGEPSPQQNFENSYLKPRILESQSDEL